MSADPVSLTATPAAGHGPLLDREQIDGLIAAAGVDGTREIIDTFWRSTDQIIAALRAELGAGDLAAAARSAHALKGSALNVGAMRFSCAARGLEDACKTGDAAAAESRLDTALTHYEETVAAFDQVLRDAA